MKKVFVNLSKFFLLLFLTLSLIFWYLQFFWRWFILLDRYSDLYINADKSWFDIIVYSKNPNFIITDIQNNPYKDGKKLTVYTKLRYFLSETQLLNIENKTNKITITLSEKEFLNIYVLDSLFGFFGKKSWLDENLSLETIKNNLQFLSKTKDFWLNQVDELLKYESLNIPLRLTKINKLLRNGDYSRALNEYEFLKKISINTENYKKLFWVLSMMKSFAKIWDSENMLDDFFADKKSLYFQLGNIYYDIWNELYNQENWTKNSDTIIYTYLKAVSYFDKVIILDSNFSDAYKMKWIVLMDIGVPDMISQWVLEKAIETNPNNAYAYYKLWNIYRKMTTSSDNNEKAMEKYLKAISIEENENFYFNLWSVQIRAWLLSQWLDSRKKAYSICKESCIDIANTTLSNLYEYNSFEELKRIAEKATLWTQDERALGYYYLSIYYIHTKQKELSDFYLKNAYETWIKKFLQ